MYNCIAKTQKYFQYALNCSSTQNKPKFLYAQYMLLLSEMRKFHLKILNQIHLLKSNLNPQKVSSLQSS